MGMWWFPLSENEINKLTETSGEDIYLQIEQYNQKNIIAIKYSVPKRNINNKELSKEDFEKKVKNASEKRKEIFTKLENIVSDFQKKYFRAGQYMTVGYLEFESTEDCKKKIKLLQKTLQTYVDNLNK